MHSVVAKFGGSSVKDAQNMKGCAQLIKNNPHMKICILSATYQTTNQLEQCARLSTQGELSSALLVLEKMRERHRQLSDDLEVQIDLEDLWEEAFSLSKGMALLKECSPAAMDRLYSLGERVSSRIFARFLSQFLSERKVHLMKATDVLITSEHHQRAQPYAHLIQEKLKSLWSELLNDPQSLIITQGFIGASLEGKITTLGREGSDYSAALLAQASQASELHIYSDVDGIYTSDPHKIKNTQKLKQLSYTQAGLMAQLGAKVLFPQTLAPVKNLKIPVKVAHSQYPERGFTLIDENQPLALIGPILMDQLILLTFHCHNKKPEDILRFLWESSGPIHDIQIGPMRLSLALQAQYDFSSSVYEQCRAWAQIERHEQQTLLSLVGTPTPSQLLLIQKNCPQLRPFSFSSDYLRFSIPSEMALSTQQEIHDLLWGRE